MNVFISFVFSVATVVSIVGLAFLMSQLLFQSKCVSDDPSDRRTRKKWLYAFCLVLTMMLIEVGVAFFLCCMNGATPLAAGRVAYVIGSLLPSVVFYIWLVYRLGYCGYGTKYLLCAIIFGLLHLFNINFVFELIKSIFLTINSIKNGPLGSAAFSTVATTYQLMVAFSVLYYLIQSIYLYRANKKYNSIVSRKNNDLLNDDSAI